MYATAKKLRFYENSVFMYLLTQSKSTKDKVWIAFGCVIAIIGRWQKKIKR